MLFLNLAGTSGASKTSAAKTYQNLAPRETGYEYVLKKSNHFPVIAELSLKLCGKEIIKPIPRCLEWNKLDSGDTNTRYTKTIPRAKYQPQIKRYWCPEPSTLKYKKL